MQTPGKVAAGNSRYTGNGAVQFFIENRLYINNEAVADVKLIVKPDGAYLYYFAVQPDSADRFTAAAVRRLIPLHIKNYVIHNTILS